MIKHIVAFRFKPEISAEQRNRILSGLDGFPKQFPTMRNWTMGENISKRDDRFSHAFIVEFESEKDLTDYLNSEAHEVYVAEHFRPYIRERMIVSYEF